MLRELSIKHLRPLEQRLRKWVGNLQHGLHQPRLAQLPRRLKRLRSSAAKAAAEFRLRPLPMKYVRLLVITDDLPQASLTLAETESFHPDTRAPDEQMLSGIPGRDYRDLYQQARSRLEKIAKVVPLEEMPEIGPLRVVEHDELRAVNEQLSQRWAEASRFEEAFGRIDEQHRFVREQQAALENFSNLKIDLGTLRNKTRFFDFYVGVVPRENVSRLEGAVKLADHLLFRYLQRGDSAHVVIVGPRGEKESAARVGARAPRASKRCRSRRASTTPAQRQAQ
jgi:V/A-type H+-transporting ATPase subunit I